MYDDLWGYFKRGLYLLWTNKMTNFGRGWLMVGAGYPTCENLFRLKKWLLKLKL
jgi:hypothetical protein